MSKKTVSDSTELNTVESANTCAGEQNGTEIDLRETPEYKEFGFQIVKCPVCGNETLDSYFICPHCKWEYDGSEGAVFSDANGCSANVYRQFINKADYLKEVDAVREGYPLFFNEAAKSESDVVIVCDKLIDALELRQKGCKCVVCPALEVITKTDIQRVKELNKKIVFLGYEDFEELSKSAVKYMYNHFTEFRICTLLPLELFLNDLARFDEGVVYRNSMHYIHFMLRDDLEAYEYANVETKLEILKKCVELLAKIPDALELEVYLNEVSDITKTDKAVLRAEVIEQQDRDLPF